MILSFVSLAFITNKVMNLLLLLLGTYLLADVFDLKLHNKILFTVLFIGISSVIELIVVALIMALFSITMEEATTGLYNIMGLILSKHLAILLFRFIKHSKHNILPAKYKKHYSIVYTLPITTLITIFPFFYSMQYSTLNLSLNFVYIVSLILLVMSNVLIFHYIDGIVETLQNEQRLAYAEKLVQQQKKQYDLLFEQNHTIMKLKHDYKNFIIGTLSELEQKKYSSVSKRLHNEINAIEDFSKKALTGNSIIDTILNHKIAAAKDKNISIDLSYKNIHQINISGIDLSILLGNALDNAIEATEKLLEKNNKNISVFIAQQDQRIIITITNFVLNNIEIDNLKTSKDDTLLHGYGIINMKNIATKYNGEISFSCVNNIFRTSIFLNNCNE